MTQHLSSKAPRRGCAAGVRQPLPTGGSKSDDDDDTPAEGLSNARKSTAHGPGHAPLCRRRSGRGRPCKRARWPRAELRGCRSYLLRGVALQQPAEDGLHLHRPVRTTTGRPLHAASRRAELRLADPGREHGRATQRVGRRRRQRARAMRGSRGVAGRSRLRAPAAQHRGARHSSVHVECRKVVREGERLPTDSRLPGTDCHHYSLPPACCRVGKSRLGRASDAPPPSGVLQTRHVSR